MILFKVNSKSSIYVRLLYSMAVLCLLTALSSCSDDDAPAEIIPNPDSEIYFTKSLDFTSDSGEAILSFTTNKDWSINVSQSGGDVSWCTVFPNKGKAGENQVLVKVIRNEGVDDRNVVLNLAAGDLTKSIVVTQKQKDAITLTTAKFEVDKNGGEIQVEVKANVTYEVVIPEQYQSWIREGSGSGQIIMGDKGHNQMHESATRTDMDRTMRKFYISKSEEYDKREGEIIFRSGELEEVLKVYQTGGGILLLTKNEYTVSDKGEQITVELNSNFDFDVKMPQVDMSFDNLVKNYYQVDKTTYIGADELCEEALLGRDMSIEKSGNGPDILIYHTHSQEGYSDSIDTSETETVVGVGDRLESLLREKYGYNVLHHKGQYDVNDRDHAYSNSLPEITEIIEKNPSIKVVIDLHRDGVAETTRLAATIDGKPMAQIMFFNGLCRTAARGPINSLPNEYLGDNLAFSFQLQLMANEYYPGLARRIYLKGYRYNMHLCPKSLLVEVGAQTNTKEEAYNAMEPLADILDKVLK